MIQVKGLLFIYVSIRDKPFSPIPMIDQVDSHYLEPSHSWTPFPINNGERTIFHTDGAKSTMELYAY
jgi:hypothetical protein